jgi:flagellar motor switch protein FliG
MTLSKTEQAAVVLANLPRVEAEQIISQLEPLQAANVKLALVSKSADENERRAILLEFLASELQQLAADRGAIWEHASPRAIARCLTDERSTTIALVLSHLPSVMLGEVLAHLSSEQQLDVRSLLSRWRGADAQIVALVFDTLARRLSVEASSSVQSARPTLSHATESQLTGTLWNRFARANAS